MGRGGWHRGFIVTFTEKIIMLQNANDVKSWDERLKAQSVGHYDNYVKRRIDLSTARMDEPLIIP